MKKIIGCISLLLIAGVVLAQSAKNIKLNPPSLERGFPVMKALQLRSSVTEWDTTMLAIQDLSDLLWAANGINRPDIGKRTAPSAMNAQDVDIYVVMKTGVYLYNAQLHQLEFLVTGDHRALVAERQEYVAKAPVICVLISDISRFSSEDKSLNLQWAAMDAGIVSQNIALFCSGVGFATRPRATMNQQKLRQILQLKDTQHALLNNPVSYRAE